ncbi:MULTISPECIES: nickel-dependent lactate racemase family protein [Pseudothermotoga]|jgi:nickel-dependent lactate racemase|uniref:nickel-dependent lactate racemase n=1 Tax=Pseudothermotoga TaxID=1643951 RepID=UPI00041B883C|nr:MULTISPECIES: nickel-dependent lactate racemase [Pseudothermotoga]MDK2885146.1 lactate racemase [Pseudothermotoga sp.]
MFKIVELFSGDFEEKVFIHSENLKAILIPKESASRPVENPRDVVEKMLNMPVDSKSLELLLSEDSRVSIVVDDATRQTPTKFILKILLKKLEKIRVKKKNIVMQIANGLHRLTTLEEKKKIFGMEILEKFEVHDNDTKNDQYQYFGETSKGTPLFFNKRVTSADLIVTIGMIKSHSFAGFTGGAKSILPGISNEKTVLSNHRFEFIEYPNGILGDAEKSMVRQDMEEAAKKLPVFIINVVLNDKNQIIDVVAGDVIGAHRKGVEAFKKMAEVFLKEPMDLVVVEGGYPGSINFYQALFGCNVVLTTPKPVLKENGIIILFAQCKEGMGSDIIEELFTTYRDPKKVLKYLKASSPLPEQWAAQFLASFLLRARLIVITSNTLLKDKLKNFGITCFNSTQEAIDNFIAENEKINVAVIKNPDFLIPNLE